MAVYIVGLPPSANEGFLPADYFVVARQALRAVSPRPNGEASANARHRWAWYDGSTPHEYDVAVGVMGGAAPLVYQLISGLPGMTVGRLKTDSNYGRVRWTPTGSVTDYPVTVRVFSQTIGESIDVSWTVSTSSSTSRFVWMAPGGNDANPGTPAAPKQTLAGVFGSTYAATANPGAIVIARGGTYTLPLYSDNEINPGYTSLQMHSTRKPIALLGYPGETVSITGNRLVIGTTGNDFLLKDVTFDGGPAVINFKLFWLWGNRLGFDGVRWINATAGAPVSAGQSDNATMFFGSDGTFAEYTHLRNCHESGRVPVSGQANNYGFCDFYARRYLLIEDSSVQGQASALMYLKGGNQDVCVQYCNIEATGSVENIASEGFQSPNRIHWRFNKIKAPDGMVSRHTFESATSNLWMDRNTFYGVRVDGASPTTGGPYLLADNVIVTDSLPRVRTGALWTNTGTECQGGLADGIVDPSTLLLTGASRTNFLGRRGHEIYNPG